MVVFPNAKINLGIRVLRKRPDGFHDIDTLFYPIPLYDVLELIDLPVLSEGHTIDLKISESDQVLTINLKNGHLAQFHQTGLYVEGPADSNLCVKAVKLFDSIKPLQSSYYIHLHKVIPSGAGLGGGSSDAAFVLKTLNHLENSLFTEHELAEMSLTLGSDCPFFISNKPSYGKGRGELLTQVEFSLSGYHIVLVKPPVHMSTADAFKGIFPKLNNSNYDITSLPSNKWQSHLVNDFESVVFGKHPEVGLIKKHLLEAGAVYAAMTGSGSAVYGLFQNQNYRFEKVPEYFYLEAELM